MEPERFLGARIARGFAGHSAIRWPLERASTVFELKYGKALVEPNRRPGAVPVFGTNGRCGTHDTPLFKGPGVVLGRKGQGPLGVEWVESDFWVIDTAYALSLLRDDVDLKFSYYLIKYVGLNHLKDGTSNPSLSRDTFGAQLFPLPPPRTQRAISNILSTIDDKIQLNRRTNETLEAMARAVFKSWFVDFDPVRAKAAGRAPGGMDAEAAKLFPSEFVESELGPIPKGWTVAPLRELTSYLSRGLGPAYVDTGGVRVLNQKCIRDHRVDFSKARRHDPAKKAIEGRLVQDLDVLVNSTGVGTLGRVAQLWSLPEETIVDSHLTVVRAAETVDPWFLGTLLLGRELEIEALGEGSTGQTELNRTRLGALPCVVPREPLGRRFGSSVASLFRQIATNDNSTLALAHLRDTLLPRLLSGEIPADVSLTESAAP